MKRFSKTTFFISLAIFILLIIILTSTVISSLALFNDSDSKSIAIIGGADGPTAILITSTLIYDNPIFLLIGFTFVLLIVSALGWFFNRNK